MVSSLPLVSICIPNYNYAQYLPRCLESACNQSYKNIEIIFNDNNSTDNSWDIAVDFKRKYKDKFFFYVGSNRFNVGSDSNCVQLLNMAAGKYLIFLSSDDFIVENFIEKAIEVMESQPTIGMVMGERSEIDENDNIIQSLPFFNTSFYCPGEDMAAVNMMSGIAVPSQCLMSKSAKMASLRYITYSLSVAGDWMANFALACVSDIAYLKEPYVFYRVHNSNETQVSEKNLTAVMEHYLLLNIFARMAQSAGFTKPQRRLPEAVEKLSNMCLRYVKKMLLNNELKAAQSYLHLAKVFCERITHNELYGQLANVFELPAEKRYEILVSMADSGVMRRSVSYEPPENFIEL